MGRVWSFKGKHWEAEQQSMEPHNPISSQPNLSLLEQCHRGNYLGAFWNCHHCLVSPRQSRDPELPPLKYKPGWKTATGGANQSWEKDRFELFIFTQYPAASWTWLPWPFPCNTVIHISANLFFQPPLVTLRWIMMTKIDLKWGESQRSLALFWSIWQ